jgi:hypothetical protein
MRHFMNLVEMAAATPAMTSGVYYHGCSVEALSQQVIDQGLRPQDLTTKYGKKGMLRPVEGRVYLAQDIAYALVYAIGGDMAGHDGGEWMERQIAKDGQYGYVFVIPGSELGDVQPDEDWVGGFISKHTKTTWEGPHGRMRPRQEYVSDGVDDVQKRQVYDYICRAMTDNQRKQAIDGYLANQAAGGKRALKNMPDWMKLKMIEWGAHVASTGNLMPSQAWRIDKRRIKELAKDGSNFFEIAERVK